MDRIVGQRERYINNQIDFAGEYVSIEMIRKALVWRSVDCFIVWRTYSQMADSLAP